MKWKYAVIFIAAIMVSSTLIVVFSPNGFVVGSANISHSNNRGANGKVTESNPVGSPMMLSGSSNPNSAINMNSVPSPISGNSFANLFSNKNPFYTINPPALSGQKYKVSFALTGLPSGASWNLVIISPSIFSLSSVLPLSEALQINLTNQIAYYNTSSASSMIALLPNGTYVFYAGPENTFLDPVEFNVTGSSLSLSINFPAFNLVYFEVTNLQAGVSWNVYTISTSGSELGAFFYAEGSSSTIEAYLPAGTYEIGAGPLSTYIQENNYTVITTGGSITEKFTFPTMYKVTFTAKNLMKNSEWLVEANLLNGTASYINGSTGASKTGYLPNSVYTVDGVEYNAIGSSITTSTLTVSNSAVSSSIDFPFLYEVNFIEKKLPANMPWIVNIYPENGTGYSYSNFSTGVSLTFYLTNGSYAYNANGVGSLLYYFLNPNSLEVSGSFNVSGSSLTVNIQFPQAYDVTITHNYLPAGLEWLVYIFSSSYTLYINLSYGPTMHFYLSNGSYPLSYIGWQDSGLISGNIPFNVSGHSVNLTVHYPYLYRTTITESNVPAGISWYFVATPPSISTLPTSSNQSYGNSMIIYLANSTYNYSATIGSGYSTLTYGSFTVAGSEQVVSVSFPILYRVTITEENLPANLEWTVFINNSNSTITYNNCSQGTSKIAYLPNSNYYLNSSGPAVKLPAQKFTVNGGSVSLFAVFPAFYKVTAKEVKLLQGLYWSLSVDNSTSNALIYDVSSTGSSQSVYLPNGTYLAIGSWSGVRTNLLTSTFTVSGKALNLTISFPTLYTVKIVAKNIPPNSYWVLNLATSSSNITVVTSVDGLSAILYLPNDTYSFFGEMLSTSTPTKTFTVNGANLTEFVSFPQSYTITFLEKNVPAGTTWSIAIFNSSTQSEVDYIFTSSTENSISLENGSYYYNASYLMQIGSSFTLVRLGAVSFVVNGSNLSLPVDFPLTYKIIFDARNLPVGLSWNLNAFTTTHLISYTNSTNGTSMVAYLPNASYSYFGTSGISGPQFFESPVVEFNETGSSLQLNVVFPGIYAIVFQQTGLPAGISWNVTLSNSTFSFIYNVNSTTSSIMIFYVENGTYNYAVDISQKGWKSTPSTGSVNISGKGTSISITIKSIFATVTFEEVGLPANVDWSITFNGTLYKTSTTSVVIAIPNGTYAYSVSTPIAGGSGFRYVDFAPSGSVVMKGINLTESVTFITQYYLTLGVSPAGTGTVSLTSEWLNASSVVSITAAAKAGYSFSEWNGAGAGNYSGPENPASVTMKGPVQETAVFVAAYYKIAFSETGLPSGVSWYVNITSMPSSGAITSSTYSVAVGNGTYSYNIGNLSSYYTNQYTGTVTVHGSNQTVSVTFEHYAYITGTLDPVNATLTINGKTESIGSSGLFNFSVPAGNYNVTASESGYKSFQTSFSLNPGSVKSLQITLSANNHPTPPPVPTTELYEILGAVVAIIVVASVSAIILRGRKK